MIFYYFGKTPLRAWLRWYCRLLKDMFNGGCYTFKITSVFIDLMTFLSVKFKCVAQKSRRLCIKEINNLTVDG